MRRFWRRRKQRPRGDESFLGFGPGVYRWDWADPYYFALSLPWRWFLVVLAASWLSINLGFASLYVLQPGSIAHARPGSLADAFFFSVQTFATVGYGVMAPQTPYAQVISCFESFIGMIWLPVIAGVVFVRFSRPRSRLVFARNLVIGPGAGGPTLAARVANRRFNLLYSLVARTVLVTRERRGGENVWQARDLHLVRDHSPVELMNWKLEHVIGPDSPLAGLNAHDLIAQHAEIIISVTAIEETTLAPVRAEHIFHAADVLFDHAFVEMIVADPAGRRRYDVQRLNKVVRADPRPAAPDHRDG
jgi:inward rectifier potassium channel